MARRSRNRTGKTSSSMAQAGSRLWSVTVAGVTAVASPSSSKKQIESKIITAKENSELNKIKEELEKTKNELKNLEQKATEANKRANRAERGRNEAEASLEDAKDEARRLARDGRKAAGLLSVTALHQQLSTECPGSLYAMEDILFDGNELRYILGQETYQLLRSSVSFESLRGFRNEIAHQNSNSKIWALVFRLLDEHQKRIVERIFRRRDEFLHYSGTKRRRDQYYEEETEMRDPKRRRINRRS